MTDVLIPPEAVQDPYEKNVPGLGLGRDPARTPMQWSAVPHAGFSSARPWLPIATDFERNNVERQQGDPGSILSLYRALLALRRARPALCIGGYRALDAGARVLGYERVHEAQRDGVLLNLGGAAEAVQCPGLERARVLLSTHRARDGSLFDGHLAPDEAVVLALAP
jgi:alpha-glucosidase